MNYIIAIPSYKRANILNQRTLAFLKRHNIPNHNIEIHVESQEMKDYYHSIIGPFYTILVSHAKGIGATRNYLRYHYKYETKHVNVLYLDDDIENIMDYDQPLEDLHGFVKKAFAITKSSKLNLWGISPFHNTFYLKDSITTTLKYIAGCCCGEIIDRNKHDIYTDVDHAEDFLFTMEHFIRDNGVIRFNKIAIITKYFEQEGGICESVGGLAERKKTMETNCKYIAERYPQMCRLIEKKYGFDLRLNHHYKNS